MLNSTAPAGATYGGGRLLETGRVSAAVNTQAFKGAVPAVAVGGASGRPCQAASSLPFARHQSLSGIIKETATQACCCSCLLSLQCRHWQ